MGDIATDYYSCFSYLKLVLFIISVFNLFYSNVSKSFDNDISLSFNTTSEGSFKLEVNYWMGFSELSQNWNGMGSRAFKDLVACPP